MKIAITGGNGFIGKRLISLLQSDGHEVVSIDTNSETPLDITDKQALIKACEGCTSIIHLAAEHRDDVFPRSRYYDVNVKGTQNVIEAANAHNIAQIIFTSTFAIYGLNTGMPNEDSNPQPFNDYGKSKLEAEHHLKDWSAEDPKRSLCILRPVVVFGESNRGNVYTLINQIQSGKFLMIGNGKNRKSMAYVGNVAGFLRHCLQLEAGMHVYNYADKPDLDMTTLTDHIYQKLGKKKSNVAIPYGLGLVAGYGFDVLARVTGKTLPISSIRVRKFCADTTCEAERFKITGFASQYTLQDGIDRMIEHDFKKSA